jgi:hypothetical protein
MKQFLSQPLNPLPANTKIDAYMDKVNPPYIEVAVIESDAFAFVDDGIKLKQLEQLKKKARQLGANTVQEVHMLAKHVQGYTIDERVPFSALQQGKYELYFLRAQAVKTPEPAPASLEAARPKGGWVIERFAPPPLRK